MRKQLLIALAVVATSIGAAGAQEIISGGVPNPAFSGFELWFNADDLNGDGVSDGTVDGSMILSWTDVTHGYVAGEPYGVPPTFVAAASGINDMPVVNLDHVELSMPHVEALNPSSDPFTIFAVGASLTEGDDDSMWIRKGNNYSADEGWSIMSGFAGPTVRINGSSGIADRASVQYPGPAIGEFSMVTGLISGVVEGETSFVNGRYNSEAFGWNIGGCGPTEQTYSYPIEPTGDVLLGRADATSQVAEILVYRGELSESQLLAVEGYLRTKYAFPEPSDPPVEPEPIYREIFPNDDGRELQAAGDVPLDETGWYIHKDGGALAATPILSWVQCPTIVEPVNSNPANDELEYGFMISLDNQVGCDFIHWTDEYMVDRNRYNVTEVTWEQRHNGGDDVTRVAVEIDGQWYASEQTFTNADGEYFATWYKESLDFASATWQDLLFTPDSQLELGTNTGLALPDGDITAFGFYTDNKSTGRLRYDTFAIYAEDLGGPEPLEGDLNGDGQVSSGDLDIVRANWGQSVTGLENGDADGDGFVGSGDLDVVRANWGATAPSAVPEPGLCLLVALGTLIMALRRK